MPINLTMNQLNSVHPSTVYVSQVSSFFKPFWQKKKITKNWNIQNNYWIDTRLRRTARHKFFVTLMKTKCMHCSFSLTSLPTY